MKLHKPCIAHIPAYVDALQRGWSPDELRPDTSQEQLRKISEDAASFVADLDDPTAKAELVTLPDGSNVSRLPSMRRWIVTIEEVAELDIEQPNAVGLLVDRAVEDDPRSPTRLLESALRLRPDRLIYGEIRGDDANMFMELVNTGHDGSVCTMHANSPTDAIGRISKMIRRGAPTVQRAEVFDDIRATIHMIIHMKKFGSERKINGVSFPSLLGVEQLT